MSAAKRKTRLGERGIALMVVLSTLTLVTAVVSQFQFESRVDLQLAFNARDGLQAEYNALSAMRLRALILKHSRQIQGGLAALGLDPAMTPPIGQLLEMIPVDCGIMSAIVHVSGKDKEDRGDGDEMFVGECSATSESEHSKISINALASVGQGRAQEVSRLLLGLLSNPAFEHFFQEDDRSGTHAESPAELVAAITDWVDPDKHMTGNQVGDEDRLYQGLNDSYRAKNAPFDSLAELQLVYGVSDELYDLLSSNVTIHCGDCTRIELATAPPDRIDFGLLASMRQGVSALDLVVNPGYAKLHNLVLEMRQLGAASFAPLKVGGLVALIQQVGLDGLIDTEAVQQMFTDQQGSTWYTIHAEGRLGNASRRITAVFQAAEGQFYYVRVD